MNQIGNILRKDIRQLRLEILASLAVLALFDWFEPNGWAESLEYERFTPVARLFAWLVCASWGILILRVVQAERLAGLNQFWTTRPYEWPKLLAAKCLFLLMFLYLPLTLSQMLLLHLGGFAVAPNVPLILVDLVLLTSLLVLPVLCVALVTTSFGQAALVMLGTAAAWTALAFVSSVAGGARGNVDLQPRFLGPLQIGIALALLAAAMLRQYSRRATRDTLVLFAAMVVVVVLLQTVLPGRPVAVTGFAPVSGDVPVAIAFDPDPKRTFGRPVSANPRHTIMLRVPLALSGAASWTSFDAEGEKVHLKGADGYVWDSPWEVGAGILRRNLGSEKDGPYAAISIPRPVWQRLGGGKVSIGMDFAFAELQDMPPYRSTLTTEDDSVPGLGDCRLDVGFPMLRCRTVFGEPQYFTIDTFWSSGESPEMCEPSPKNLVPVSGSIGRVMPGMVPFIVTVSPVQINNANIYDFGNPAKRGRLCPGTPVTYGGKRVMRRLQLKMPEATIALKDYVRSRDQ
jgi:hypothetical protein